jgi:outer membrane protein
MMWKTPVRLSVKTLNVKTLSDQALSAKTISITILGLTTIAMAMTALPVRAETLSFVQAAQTVLQQNPDLAASKARIQQAEAGFKQTEGARMPRVNLSLTASRSNDALNAFGLKLGQERISAADFAPALLNDPAAINNFNSRIEVQAPLYTGGQINARQDEARALVRAAQAGDEAARQQLTLHTLQAYQGIHLARTSIRVAEQSLKASTEMARVTDNLHQQGMAVKSDRLSARVNVEAAKLRVKEAQRYEADALDQLKMLMGRPLQDEINIGDEVLPRLPAGNAEDLRAQAINQHPGLKALRNRMDAAGAAVDAARGARKPQVSVMARQDWNDRTLGFDASSYTVAGVLSWNAFDAGASHAAIDRAQAMRMEQAANLRQSEDAIALQITASHRRALEADERVEVREAAVKDAEEAHRLTQIRYQNGVTTLVDWLSAQTQLDKARADLAQARHDRSVARGEVLHAAGLLTPEQF